jgi:glycerophosphoryl diester phosphodiesterase
MLCIAMSVEAQPAGKRIVVEGHRGARAVRPENTIAAFEYAIQAGADFIELDVAVTKDNVLVVSHDPTLHRPICQGPRDGAIIHELTLDEVRQWDCGALKNPEFSEQQPVPGQRIPTLDEVFALAAKGRFKYNVELKSDPKKPQYTPPPDEFARMVLDAIRKHRLERRVVVQSFDFRTLVAMHKLAPDIPLAALTSNDQRPFPAIAREAHASTMSPQFKLVTPEKVREAHAAGIQVVPWTANTQQEWERLVEAGVDGIITDDPAALIEYLKKRGLR